MDELIKQYASQIGRRLIAIGEAKGLKKIGKLKPEELGLDAIENFLNTSEPPKEAKVSEIPPPPKVKKIK